MNRSILACCLLGSLALSAIGITTTASISRAQSTPQAQSTILAQASTDDRQLIASGTFEGRGGHTTSGTVYVYDTPEGSVVVLGTDFFLDGAPDPKLGFGNNGYIGSTQFSELRSTRGTQLYNIDFDPSGYNEFWVWCERFSVPLGVARLVPNS